MRAMHQNVSVDSLPVGSKLDSPIHDEQGVLLLDQGIELTEAFIEGLRTRGLVWVRVGGSGKPISRASATARRGGETASSVDRLLEDISRHLSKIGDSEKGERERKRKGTFDPEAVRVVAQHIQDTAAEIDNVLADAESGRVVDINGVQEATAKTVIDVAEDTDVAVHSALQFNPTDALFRERLRTSSLQSTVLSLAIGMRLRMDATQLLHLGMAATLSDIGLVHRPDSPRIGGCVDEANKEHFW